MAENTIRSEKYEEIVENKPIGGQRNDAQELSDLVDQRSRSGRHIAISGGYQRLPYEICDRISAGQ